MDSRIKKLKLNSIIALVYQILLIITGFILPHCFLKFYGSEVYGLVSSITQFLSFINLCDMGISAVVSSAFYRPLAKHDNKKISQIFNYARNFFRKIGYILIIYVLILIFIFPKFVSNSFSNVFTITLLLAMSISQFGQYFLGITYQILLSADQKSYIQLLINGFTLIINTFLSILIMYKGFSIQIVKLLTSIIYLLRPIFMYVYIKKNYNIDYTIVPSKNIIPQKWSGVIQHVSYMIYENTDVAILTLFSTLSNVSIYSVYYLVVNSLKTVINAATTGVQALFGNMIAKGEIENLKKVYDMYDWIIHVVTTFLFTVASFLIVPFVMIYTKNTSGANYNVPHFAILITLAFGINTIRNSMYNMIRAAGQYKKTQFASMMEAILNVIISIIFVFKYGLVGVSIGTLCATSFFTIYEVIFLSKNIINRSCIKFLKQLVVDIVSIIFMYIFTCKLNNCFLNYFSWLKFAFLKSIICLIVIVFIQTIFNKKYMKIVVQNIYKKFQFR